MLSHSLLRAGCALAGCLTLTMPAAGQEVPAAGTSPRVLTDSFGVSQVSITTLPATGFYPDRSTDGYVTLANDYRSTTASNAWFESPLLLESGVEINVINLVACDTSATDGMSATVLICPLDSANCTVRGSVSTGEEEEETPGCFTFGGLVDPPVVIDNAANAYGILVFDNDNSSATRFQAVRVPWTRRISPADGTSDFPDVDLGRPASPLHRGGGRRRDRRWLRRRPFLSR